MLIEHASDNDLAQILALLERLSLPLEGVAEHVDTMIVARADGRVVGAAALELYADGALLRSVGVDSGLQGKRIGHQLTAAALDLAKEHGVNTVFLLTTTADTFFPRFGFERITRQEVPASVQASVEFQSACPASAVVMRKRFVDGDMKRIIFACVHNAGRSQMAAAFFNRLADPAKARGVSAGTDPGERVHPEVVAAMKELGMDLSSARPQRLTPEVAAGAEMLITMGCGDACPVVPGLRRDDWPLDDPKGKALDEVRRIRDAIRQRVEQLVACEGWYAPNRQTAPGHAPPLGH